MRRFVDAHHVVPWEDAGPTDMDNLLLLCPAHHRLFHEGAYRIDAPRRRSVHLPPPRRPGARPTTAAGRPGAGPAAPGEAPEPRAAASRFDLGLTIDALAG